ncbi:MAG TPA: hypothetical protein VER11_12330 [Polyangiaceae bacterium]|nr:hypothetical protein [Polyangiaceae bacterium]
MTARSVSWTDAASVAQLLARASAPRGAVQTFKLANASSAARPIPPAARIPAPAPVADTPPRAISVPPPARLKSQFPAPKLVQISDNPSDCVDALLAWTLDHQRCTGAFIADDNGLTLAAHGISEAHVSLVGPLLSALVSVRMIPGIDATAGALWLGNNMMSWVESRNERGGFCLGTVGSEPLSSRAFEQLKEALEITVRKL